MLELVFVQRRQRLVTAAAHCEVLSWHVRGPIKSWWQQHCCNRAGMRLRGVLIHEVFRKVLYLTPSERAKFSSGRIYSHVTSDVETIQQLSWSGLGIISSPLRIIGAVREYARFPRVTTFLMKVAVHDAPKQSALHGTPWQHKRADLRRGFAAVVKTSL